MRRCWKTGIGGLLATAASGGAAIACTVCHSDTAQAVRARLFGPDFLANAAAVAAPVPLLVAGLVALALPGIGRSDAEP